MAHGQGRAPVSGSLYSAVILHISWKFEFPGSKGKVFRMTPLNSNLMLKNTHVQISEYFHSQCKLTKKL